MDVLEQSKNQEIFEKSCETIVGGVNSPVRSFKKLGINPLVASRGKGALLFDADGRSFIDYCMSWGALLHGHAPDQVIETLKEAIGRGTTFGLSTLVESQLAEQIKASFPSMQKMRFVSSGTEATMTAVRLARSYTKRPYIIKFNGNYHGHSDLFLTHAGSYLSECKTKASSEGVLDESIKYTLSLPFNDLKTFRKVLRNPIYANQIAAVIVEPIAANMGVIKSSLPFLNLLREETERLKVVLIFDEVITGFRVSSGGAQKLYHIESDLTCLGKIIGGGIPAAAFGGKKEIMDQLAPLGPVFQAGTLSGNPIAMEAGIRTLKLAMQEGFYSEIEKKTDYFAIPIQEKLKKKGSKATFQSVCGMFTLFWGVDEVNSFEDLKALDQKLFKKYFKFLLERGIYISPSPYEASFISSAHTKKHLEKTLHCILEFIETQVA